MTNTPHRSKLRFVLSAITLAVVCVVAVLLFYSRKQAPATASNYFTESVDRGAISRSIVASGTINPVNQIIVGTQVSGVIREVFADYNATVRRGQMLALIDTQTIEADAASARAAVDSAKAAVSLAEINHVRNERLLNTGFIAKSQTDQTAQALASARATLKQQEAMLKKVEISRRFAEIRAPVDGTVVSLDVNVGQTVAASLQTPTLFRIAQDLREIQIDTNVSEADVGLIQENKDVTFTVDAFPNQVFKAKIAQVRNNYVVQQNVVTYTVVVKSRNDDLRLRPGMTGYVTISLESRENALRISNAALRFSPATLSPVAAANSNPARGGSSRTVWRLEKDGSISAVAITVGISDARFTEVTSDSLQPGDAIVTGQQPTKAGQFGPKLL
jgi:HlyD family secretion protein